MLYPLLADLVLIVHLMFVIFVLCGGLVVLKWRWIAWLHLPAAVWGAVVEFTGWICPLTPLENWLRVQGGKTSYEDDFTTHYLLPILYPVDLTRDVQVLLGTVVIAVNAGMYCWFWRMGARGAARDR
jgi:Protein of Unknown function (DUF2784)